MPENLDDLMDMVNNTYELYDAKNEMFDRWVQQGDALSESQARDEAIALASQFAVAVEREFRRMEIHEKYSAGDIADAAREMLKEYGDYREEAIAEAVKNASRKATPEDLRMDAGAVEHAKKYDAVARKIGIDRLRALMPVSPEKIAQALERGDVHLNTIKLRLWDRAAEKVRGVPGLSLSDKVCALKHVAQFYYA